MHPYSGMKPYNLTGIRTFIKVVEKLSKYRDIEIEIERMWHSETEVVPVVKEPLD